MMSRAVAVIVFLHSLRSVQSIFLSVGSYRKVLRHLMTWEVPFRFGQVLLFFWCHCTCLLYSLFKQLSGRDGIAWFLSILDNTVSNRALLLAALSVCRFLWLIDLLYSQSAKAMWLSFMPGVIAEKDLLFDVLFQKFARVVQWMMSAVFLISPMLSFLSVWQY